MLHAVHPLPAHSAGKLAPRMRGATRGNATNDSPTYVTKIHRLPTSFLKSMQFPVAAKATASKRMPSLVVRGVHRLQTWLGLQPPLSRPCPSVHRVPHVDGPAHAPIRPAPPVLHSEVRVAPERAPLDIALDRIAAVCSATHFDAALRDVGSLDGRRWHPGLLTLRGEALQALVERLHHLPEPERPGCFEQLRAQIQQLSFVERRRLLPELADVIGARPLPARRDAFVRCLGMVADLPAPRQAGVLAELVPCIEVQAPVDHTHQLQACRELLAALPAGSHSLAALHALCITARLLPPEICWSEFQHLARLLERAKGPHTRPERLASWPLTPLLRWLPPERHATAVRIVRDGIQRHALPPVAAASALAELAGQLHVLPAIERLAEFRLTVAALRPLAPCTADLRPTYAHALDLLSSALEEFPACEQKEIGRIELHLLRRRWSIP